VDADASGIPVWQLLLFLLAGGVVLLAGGVAFWWIRWRAHDDPGRLRPPDAPL
jgi:hypothetical protein